MVVRPGISEANLMALNERRGPRPCDELHFRDAFRRLRRLR